MIQAGGRLMIDDWREPGESEATRNNDGSMVRVIDLNRLSRLQLNTVPYRWAAIDQLFSPEDAALLAATFPLDHFKSVAGHDGEKTLGYDVRCLIRSGERSISRRKQLSGAWRTLATEFLSAGYRTAMSTLTGVDLSTAPLETNVFQYPPGGSLGPHPDHRDKVVTHIMYFNESWSVEEGGCLLILRSSDPHDIAMKVSPLAGNSAVLVRSDNSWHAVSGVVNGCRLSRRCVVATFYRPGCVSQMWPSWGQVLRTYPSRLKRLVGRR